jgi:hypothetical protein
MAAPQFSSPKTISISAFIFLDLLSPFWNEDSLSLSLSLSQQSIIYGIRGQSPAGHKDRNSWGNHSIINALNHVIM